MPYSDQMIESTPEICKEGRDLWLACVSLISFHIIEMHLLDRFMRQFGGIQRILEHYETDLEHIHLLSLKGKCKEH